MSSQILLKYPDFSGAVVALNKTGFHGAACHGMAAFPYSVAGAGSDQVVVFTVRCAPREAERGRRVTQQEVPKIETV